jgi:beta-N-acetylhexosaminidase
MPSKRGRVLLLNSPHKNTSLSDIPLPLASVFSVAGPTLSPSEKSLFSAAQPFGFILFGRNIETETQVKKLCDQLRSCVGWDCPILIDQEGGRVARMKPPHWDEYLAAQAYGLACAQNPAEGKDRLRKDMIDMAKMLMRAGVDVNCAPVLDVVQANTTDAVASRCYSADPHSVFECADIVAQAFLSQGVTPVIKHLPGHGRAILDSHYHLPVIEDSLDILRNTDFEPFSKMSKAPYAASLWGMVAHILYPALDPDYPSSLSSIVIDQVIRRDIGFQGLLLTDDLDMKALDKYGSIADRADKSLQAGCDLALYCWADLKVMESLAARLPPLSQKGWERWQNSLMAQWQAA